MGLMCHYVDWFASLHMALCLLQASKPTMSCICLSGTYADFPAEMLTDPTKFHLTLSTQFSCTHNVPCSITSIYRIAQVACSSPIIVPTEGGWFHSQLPFKIVYSSQANMHLGVDWIKICQPEFVHGWYLSTTAGHIR
jgi:hypothetical protein